MKYIQLIAEFPLNDHWVYTNTIYSFIYQGKIDFSNMKAIPFLTQYLIGIGVVKLFSFFCRLVNVLIGFLEINLYVYILNIKLK